jgi:hypothetical protein
MAKEKDKQKNGKAETGKTPVIAPEQAAGGDQHHAASAHGRAARIDKSLPADRDALIALHAEARRRRAAAPLGSEAYRAAVDEIARIEIRIADVDRAASPPRG